MSLPPLPEPGLVCNLSVYYGIAVNKTVLDPLFGTDQMREYGALCRKMALEEAAGICDDISTQHNDTYKHKPEQRSKAWTQHGTEERTAGAQYDHTGRE